MKTIVVLFLVTCCVYAQVLPEIVTTGEGLNALGWNGIGRVELGSSNPSQRTLSNDLPRTFTFECWFITPNAADGRYKTIIARYRQGPNGEKDNRWADFNLQVQRDGTLDFFMGNGMSDSYGINLETTTVQSNVWNHVSFSVVTTAGRLDPMYTTVILNGSPFSQAWIDGDRQELRSQPIVLGDYQNQDGDTKYWVGALDEVRFWAGLRDPALLTKYQNWAVPQPYSDSGIPLAYYRFNLGTGFGVDDEAGIYDGEISETRGVVNWVLSGVKIYPARAINDSETRSFILPGASVNGTFGFTYVIGSLPVDPSGNAAGSLWTPEGVQITTVPFPLLGNQVVYQSPSNVNCDTVFTYYGQTPLYQEAPTQMEIAVGDEPCVTTLCGRCLSPPRLSLLGVSTCNCVNTPYYGYSYTDIERVIYLFEIENTIDLMNQLEGKLENLMRQLSRYPATYDLVSLINDVQSFNLGCLQTFCNNFATLIAKVGVYQYPADTTVIS